MAGTASIQLLVFLLGITACLCMHLQQGDEISGRGRVRRQDDEEEAEVSVGISNDNAEFEDDFSDLGPIIPVDKINTPIKVKIPKDKGSEGTMEVMPVMDSVAEDTVMTALGDPVVDNMNNQVPIKSMPVQSGNPQPPSKGGNNNNSNKSGNDAANKGGSNNSNKWNSNKNNNGRWGNNRPNGKGKVAGQGGKNGQKGKNGNAVKNGQGGKRNGVASNGQAGGKQNKKPGQNKKTPQTG